MTTSLFALLHLLVITISQNVPDVTTNCPVTPGSVPTVSTSISAIPLEASCIAINLTLNVENVLPDPSYIVPQQNIEIIQSALQQTLVSFGISGATINPNPSTVPNAWTVFNGCPSSVDNTATKFNFVPVNHDLFVDTNSMYIYYGVNDAQIEWQFTTPDTVVFDFNAQSISSLIAVNCVGYSMQAHIVDVQNIIIAESNVFTMTANFNQQPQKVNFITTYKKLTENTMYYLYVTVFNAFQCIGNRMEISVPAMISMPVSSVSHPVISILAEPSSCKLGGNLAYWHYNKDLVFAIDALCKESLPEAQRKVFERTMYQSHSSQNSLLINEWNGLPAAPESVTVAGTGTATGLRRRLQRRPPPPGTPRPDPPPDIPPKPLPTTEPPVPVVPDEDTPPPRRPPPPVDTPQPDPPQPDPPQPEEPPQAAAVPPPRRPSPPGTPRPDPPPDVPPRPPAPDEWFRFLPPAVIAILRDDDLDPFLRFTLLLTWLQRRRRPGPFGATGGLPPVPFVPSSLSGGRLLRGSLHRISPDLGADTLVATDAVFPDFDQCVTMNPDTLRIFSVGGKTTAGAGISRIAVYEFLGQSQISLVQDLSTWGLQLNEPRAYGMCQYYKNVYNNNREYIMVISGVKDINDLSNTELWYNDILFIPLDYTERAFNNIPKIKLKHSVIDPTLHVTAANELYIFGGRDATNAKNYVQYIDLNKVFAPETTSADTFITMDRFEPMRLNRIHPLIDIGLLKAGDIYDDCIMVFGGQDFINNQWIDIETPPNGLQLYCNQRPLTTTGIIADAELTSFDIRNLQKVNEFVPPSSKTKTISINKYNFMNDNILYKFTTSYKTCVLNDAQIKAAEDLFRQSTFQNSLSHNILSLSQDKFKGWSNGFSAVYLTDISLAKPL